MASSASGRAESVSDHMWKLWLALDMPDLDLRVLTFLGSHRKYSGRKVWLRAMVWLSYTAADSVTSFAIGIISHSRNSEVEICRRT